MTVRGTFRSAVAVAVALALAASPGCTGQSEEEAFCAQLTTVRDTGPLFPSRTDGEPVPNQETFEALVALGERPPEDIRDEVEILVDEASALVAEAEARRSGTQVGPTPSRWSRNAVEAAQSAVTRFAAVSCDIDLNRLAEPEPTETTTAATTSE